MKVQKKRERANGELVIVTDHPQTSFHYFDDVLNNSPSRKINNKGRVSCTLCSIMSTIHMGEIVDARKKHGSSLGE